MSDVISWTVDHTLVPMGDFIGWSASHGVLLAIFAIAWVAFGVALVMNQGGLDEAWKWLTGLPIVLQAVVWLLFLPVAIGLWIWESSWPLIVRLVLVVGLAGWNILIMLPRTTPEP